MSIRRVWEKPWRWKALRDKGHFAWIVSCTWTDYREGTSYHLSGYGRTKAEAKRDLKCNKMQCGYKHAKPHKIVYEEVI